jgi:hypothetical protein
VATDPHDAKTPKVGSLNWPFFQEVAMQVLEASSEAALRAEKIPFELDVARAKELRRIAKEAKRLLGVFASFANGTTDPAIRHTSIKELFDLRDAAKALRVDVDGYKL